VIIKGSFGGEFWVSHVSQWGLCCIVVFCLPVMFFVFSFVLLPSWRNKVSVKVFEPIKLSFVVVSEGRMCQMGVQLLQVEGEVLGFFSVPLV